MALGTSPRSFPQSSSGRFEVIIVDRVSYRRITTSNWTDEQDVTFLDNSRLQPVLCDGRISDTAISPSCCPSITTGTHCPSGKTSVER